MMTEDQNPLVVGIFDEETEAVDALQDLHNAGFGQDQLGFARHDQEKADPNLEAEMARVGVPQEQASYYGHEYQAGHPVVSVRADGREDEAAQILSTHGATGLSNPGDIEPTNPNEQVDPNQPMTNNTFNEAADQTANNRNNPNTSSEQR